MFTNHKLIEDEVLFMTDTKFSIKSVDRVENIVTLVELETQFDTNFIAYECYDSNYDKPIIEEDDCLSFLDKSNMKK